MYSACTTQQAPLSGDLNTLNVNITYGSKVLTSTRASIHIPHFHCLYTVHIQYTYVTVNVSRQSLHVGKHVAAAIPKVLRSLALSEKEC